MENLEMQGDNDNSYPHITFNAQHGKLEIRGYSMPIDARLIYEPVLRWLTKYAEAPHSSTEFIFHMQLINTASSKFFYEIFLILNDIVKSGKSVKVIWEYSFGDDDIHQTGIDFKSFSVADFEFIAVND